METFDAVVIGDANIDLVVVGCDQVPQPGQEVFVDNMMMHLGGGAALFSVSLAKLGLHVAFNGVLGDDGNGRFIREIFIEYGIDTRMVQTSRVHNTGISIAFHPDTDRSFITYAGSNVELQVDKLDLNQIAQGKHVHMTGYRGKRNHEQYVELAKALKQKGLTLSCDVGWDDSGEWDQCLFEFMSYFDVFLMNETEALHYTGLENIEESLHYMADYCSHVVIKLGASGSIALKDGLMERHLAYQVEAIDTTGAGDSFNAGYIYGYLSGMDAAASLKYGNACGALSVGAYGGSTGTTNLEGLKTFISQRDEDLAIPESTK